MTLKKQFYNADEIFQDIPGDAKNVQMTIPSEILEAQGWKEGDTLEWHDNGDGSWALSKKKEVTDVNDF